MIIAYSIFIPIMTSINEFISFTCYFKYLQINKAQSTQLFSLQFRLVSVAACFQLICRVVICLHVRES